MMIKQMLKDRTLTDKERKNLAILEVVRIKHERHRKSAYQSFRLG